MTPSYLKRVEQGGAKGSCTMESGAEASTAVFCSWACIRAGSSLFFFLASIFSCSTRKSKCVRSSFIPPSLYPTQFLRVLRFFLFPALSPFLSLFYFVSLLFLVRFSFSPSYLLHLLHLFSPDHSRRPLR